MKKFRATGLILCICLLLCSFSLNAFASSVQSDINENTVESSYIDCAYDGAVEALPKLALNSSYKFYDNLSSVEKDIYDAFVRTKCGLSSSPRGSISVTFSRNQTISASTPASLNTAIKSALWNACSALGDDRPEFFWVLSAPFDASFSASVVMPSISSITFQINFSLLTYNNINELERDYNALLSAVNKFPVYGKTVYEKASSIHDTLCDMASYATDINSYTAPDNSKVFFPVSALVYPNETVCDGYSKAYKMICDKHDIPCIVVAGESSGGGHAWNYVRMPDRKWYAVDLTWDDLDRSDVLQICTDEYFLVGGYSLDRHTRTFSETHTPTGKRFTMLVNPLVYPDLSRTAYVPDLSDISMLGDVNLDGKISIADVRKILYHIIREGDETKGRTLLSAGKLAADYNQDSSIDLVDAKLILTSISDMEV